MTTAEALEEWADLIDEVSEKWGDLMDEVWKDLPPDVAKKIITASNAFADTSDAIKAALQHQ